MVTWGNGEIKCNFLLVKIVGCVLPNHTVASETLEGVFLLNNSMSIHHRTLKPSAPS